MKYNKQIVLNTCGNNPIELQALIQRLKDQQYNAEQYKTEDKKKEVERTKEFILFCENIKKELLEDTGNGS